MRRMLLAGVILVLALSGTAARAQPAPVSIRQVSDEGGALTVVATVLDADGRPLAGLAPDAFELRLDGAGVPAEEVRYAADPQIGLAVVVAIDVSGSMAGPRIENARRAAATFVDTLGPNDQVALLAFNSEVAYFADFTSDRASVQAIIQRLGAAGNTALYRATVDAVNKAASAPLPRKAVVLLTDGENVDPPGRVTREAAIEAARRSGVPVYGVGLGAEADQAYVDQLAQATRGEARYAPSPADLDQLYRGISYALRGQYVLRAHPGPVKRAPSHTVRITVNLSGTAAADEATFAGAGLAVLPDPTPTPTPAPAATPAPPTPAAVVTSAPTAVPLPAPVAAPEDSGRPVLLMAAAMLGLAAAGGGVWLARRRHGTPAEPAPSGPRAPLPRPPGSALSSATPALLQVMGGPLTGLEVPVGGEPVTIGTGEDCRVVLPVSGDGVERRHARIWHRDGRYMLHRLARTGTIQMSSGPVEWVVLEPEDEFTIGAHRFRFHVNGTS